jgi:hypothetical protein
MMNEYQSANDHLSPSNHLLLSDLGRLLGLTLSMPDGALRLIAATGQEWFLEITADGGLWIIHTELAKRSHATPALLESYLQSNSRIELMRGATICIEPQTNTVRLTNAIRAEHLDIRSLEDTLAHMKQLHEELSVAE